MRSMVRTGLIGAVRCCIEAFHGRRYRKLHHFMVELDLELL
jgi:hypothetical protein